MDRNNALGLSSDTDVAEVSIADRPTQPDVHRKDDGSVDPSVRATSSLLSLSSGESTELKRLSLPPRLSQSPHKNRPSLRRPSTSPMSSPQPPPQARLAPPSPRHSLSRRQHRSSPLSEVAFSSTNPIKLDDPVGGWSPGPLYKPSRISSVYLSDGLSERGMATRQPWNVGEGSSSSTTTARRGSTITFSPSTASSSSRRPTTHSRYSYTYGQNSRASTSTLSTSSLSTNPGGHRPRNHYRSSVLSDSRYSVASSSSRHEDEPQLRAALDLDRLEARKQVRPGPETTDKRMSLPIGKAAEDRQAHWMAASSYGETPRFSRLGLHAQGVVLPISAREFSRRPRSAPNQHKSVSSPDVSISRGRSVRHSSVPSLTPPSPALIPSPTPTPTPTPTSPPVPPMLTRPRQVSISKPNKLKKPRPPSLPPPMPPRPIIILDTPPACATSLPLYSAAEPEGEVEVEHGPDVARGYQSQPQTYNCSNGGIDATSGILEVRREEDGNDPSLSPISMSSSETGLPRTSSDSSVASSAPSLCVSSSHSLNLSTSSSFYTTRTTFTEETTPSSSIFVLSVERETGEGDDEVHPPDLPEVGSNEQVDSEPNSLPECNLDDPPRGTPDIVPTLIQTAEPPSSDNTSPQPTSQRRRSIVSRVCSFRSVRSFHPRPRSRVTSSASVPPPPLVPIPISTPVTLPPAAVTMPPPPPPSHSTSKRASLFRTSTGTKLKKKRRPSTVNGSSKNLPLAADAALNLGPNPQTVDVPSLDSAKPLDEPANATIAKHPSEHTGGKRTIFDRLFFRRGVSE